MGALFASQDLEFYLDIYSTLEKKNIVISEIILWHNNFFVFRAEDIEGLRTLVLQWVGALDLFFPRFVEVPDAGSVE